MSARLPSDDYRETAENGLAAARDTASAGAVGSELAETVSAAQTCALLYVGAVLAELVEELRKPGPTFEATGPGRATTAERRQHGSGPWGVKS